MAINGNRRNQIYLLHLNNRGLWYRLSGGEKACLAWWTSRGNIIGIISKEGRMLEGVMATAFGISKASKILIAWRHRAGVAPQRIALSMARPASGSGEWKNDCNGEKTKWRIALWQKNDNRKSNWWRWRKIENTYYGHSHASTSFWLRAPALDLRANAWLSVLDIISTFFSYAMIGSLSIMRVSLTLKRSSLCLARRHLPASSNQPRAFRAYTCLYARWRHYGRKAKGRTLPCATPAQKMTLAHLRTHTTRTTWYYAGVNLGVFIARYTCHDRH